jgi:hypothetical protein
MQCWGEVLIDQLFQPYDAAAIKKLPLSDRAPKDELFWPGTKSDMYIVRSGYRFLLDEEIRNLPSSSNMSQISQVWRAVWELKVPKKIQIFAWRALKDSLASKLNLWKRKVLMDPACEHCAAQTEDIMHALWLCPCVQPAWEKEEWLISIQNSQVSDFIELWNRVSGLSSTKELKVFITICWAIW